MSWIQENKVAAISIGAGAVVSLALVGVGFNFSSAADEATLEYQNKLSAIKSLESAPTTPEVATVKQLDQSVDAYATRVDKLKKRLTSYGTEEIEPVTGQAFNDRLKKTVEEFQSRAKAKGVIVPDEFYMGFEDYRQKLPKSDAAGYLDYELTATSWLFDQLLQEGLERVISVVRKPISAEQTVQEPIPARPRAAAARSKKKAAPPEVMVRMPIEIVVEARKESWAKVLTAIASDDAKHFFVIRGLRVVNEKTVGPNKDEVKFDQPNAAAVGGLGGDFDFIIPPPEDELEEEDDEQKAEDDKFEMPEKASGDEIVKPVLGTENIFIALQLDIVHFLPSIEVPGLPEPTPASTPAPSEAAPADPGN